MFPNVAICRASQKQNIHQTKKINRGSFFTMCEIGNKKVTFFELEMGTMTEEGEGLWYVVA